MPGGDGPKSRPRFGFRLPFGSRDRLTAMAFGEALARAVLTVEPAAEIVSVDANKLRLSLNGAELFVSIPAAYADYAQSKNLEETLGRWTRGVLSQREDRAPDLHRAISMLRPLSFVRGQIGADEYSLVYRPFVADLVEVIAIADPDRRSFLSRDGLGRLGIEEEEAFSIARTNLAAMIGDVSIGPLSEGVMLVKAGLDLAPSLVFLPDRCSDMASQIGDPLFVVPFGRDHIFIGPAADERACGQVRRLIEEFRDDRTLSEQVLVWTAGRWSIADELH
jgi:hypothetical protein